MNILEVNHITKKYGTSLILDDINLRISKGKVYGLFGVDSNGTTTLIKLINKLLIPDDGEILFKNNPMGVESREEISYLPDKDFLDENMNALGAIKFYQDFYKDFNSKKALKYIDLFDVDKHIKIYKMSKGMKDKLSFILIMSRNSTLYVIDEALTGVDSITREKMFKTLYKNRNKDSSIIISSHILDDLDSLIDEIIILDKGKIVENKSIDKNTSIKGYLRRYSNDKEII